MSEQFSDPIIGASRQARDSVGRVLDAQGNTLDTAREEGQNMLDQMRDYMREQPVSAALIVLGVGYILGRLKII